MAKAKPLMSRLQEAEAAEEAARKPRCTACQITGEAREYMDSRIRAGKSRSMIARILTSQGIPIKAGVVQEHAREHVK